MYVEGWEWDGDFSFFFSKWFVRLPFLLLLLVGLFFYFINLESLHHHFSQKKFLFFVHKTIFFYYLAIFFFDFSTTHNHQSLRELEFSMISIGTITFSTFLIFTHHICLKHTTDIRKASRFAYFFVEALINCTIVLSSRFSGWRVSKWNGKKIKFTRAKTNCVYGGVCGIEVVFCTEKI